MSTSPRTITGWSLIAAAVIGGGFLTSQAASKPGKATSRTQVPNHSSICTSDGSVRDDELAERIANEINDNGEGVKDVKIITNTCFGGGLLNDIQRVFGPDGICPGVPWVFGAAAGETRVGWSFRPEWCDDPNSNLGGKFTSALAGPQSGHSDTTPGSMRDPNSNNVLADLNTAAQHDEAAADEHPVTASGNGGDQVTWHSEGTSHEVVLFGGRMDPNEPGKPAYDNDHENMSDALLDLYGGAPCNVQTVSNGSRQDLFDAIHAACDNLDENTQLVLYFNGHGDGHMDFAQFCQFYGLPWPLVVPESEELEFDLHEGWVEGLQNMEDDPDQTPEPTLSFNLVDPIESDQWAIELNGVSIPLARGILVGQVTLPVPWQCIQATGNILSIHTTGGPPGGLFVCDAMELATGPIALLMDPPQVIPAVSAPGLAGVVAALLIAGVVLLRRRGHARVEPT